MTIRHLNVKYQREYTNMSENNESEVSAKASERPYGTNLVGNANTEHPDQTMRYASYIVMVLVLCALIYFAYKKFNANKSEGAAEDDDDCGESGKGGKKESNGGGNVAGYDVHAAVGEIEALQSRVMNKVSTATTV